MYPRNAASPPRLSIGAVVQISDGAVQTSGVSLKVRPEGGAASAGGGTTAYEEGIVLYTPTQAETDYTAFVVIAYKTGCVPVSLAVVTTASATAGKVDVGAISTGAITAAAIANNAIDSASLAADVTTRIEASVWDAVRSGHVTSGTFGDVDTTAELADAVLDEVVEGSYTLRQLIRLIAASTAAKLTGAATSTVTVRDFADSKNRITATVDADGNRTPTAYDVS